MSYSKKDLKSKAEEKNGKNPEGNKFVIGKNEEQDY
jgi:hypothetical protein